MNTYLVRTRPDQVLMGMFCARDLAELRKLIEDVFDPAECEYLVLRPGEGLFVEAQFRLLPIEDRPGTQEVVLLSPIEAEWIDHADTLVAREAEGQLETERDSPAEDAADADLEDYEGFPPVIEATEALSDRFQEAEVTGWLPLASPAQSKHPSLAVAPRARPALRPVHPESVPSRLEQVIGTKPTCQIMQGNPKQVH